VNASEVKIGARELPAVTQLFTEPYMVSFLLDNSLGAWWAARRLNEADLQKSSSEEELRRKAAIPGVPLDYLRFVQQEDGTWTPAAGTFDGWPEQLAELKTLDPCCGSGHFLVAAFLMLVPMRMERDGLSAREAVDAVLRENIHGLELDQRCVELAAFALALTAWKYPDLPSPSGRGAGGEGGTKPIGYRPLPELNVACSGLSISAKKEEWLALAGDNTNLRIALEELYKQFKDAPVLGSLINPEASLGKGSLFELKWEEVGPLLTKALAEEKDDVRSEMGVIAKGISFAARLLIQDYRLIATNVPYLGMRRMHEKLYAFCEKNFPNSKQDIATVFIDRFREFSKHQTTVIVVSPQNWLVQPAYENFRNELLKGSSLRLIAQLGEHGFDSPQAAGAFVSLSILDHHPKLIGNYFSAIKAVSEKRPEDKATAIRTVEILSVSAESQHSNAQHKISFEEHGESVLIQDFAIAPQGIKTGDDEKWVLCFWEILFSKYSPWRVSQSSVNKKTFYGGREKIINWSTGGDGMIRPRLDSPALEKLGVAISQTRNKAATIYTGQLFLSTLAPVVPHDQDNLSTLWEFCSSSDFRDTVTKISPGLFATNSSILVTPIDEEVWADKANSRFPNGLPK
ncbi:MAG: SAM-dependent DNA methyltransferase, partial [Fretibacterium sp.]|nr:SAM-dependent DNA methyltransferase [Fretibacterium sp.]